MIKRQDIPLLRWVLYAFATVQFIRFYVVSTRFYLRLPAYLSGHERLPFQERVLPILLMWPINHWSALMHALANRGHDPETASAATPQTVAFYLLSLAAFSIAGLFTVKLYRAVTQSGILSPLVYPIFLVIGLWTYVIHIDANYSYPYDMPALAFFTAGLYFIYTRSFVPLLVIMLIGTLNRETTLFLIGIYSIDAASRQSAEPTASLSKRSSGRLPARLTDRFDLHAIPWLRVLALSAIWAAVKISLVLYFSRNSNAENYNRLVENVFRLKLRLLPSLLNICAYLLPVVWVYRSRLRPLRFANYLYILPVWFAIMFYTGVILETRIYGELSAYVAVAIVLLLEEHVSRHSRVLGASFEHRIIRPQPPLPVKQLDTEMVAR